MGQQQQKKLALNSIKTFKVSKIYPKTIKGITSELIDTKEKLYLEGKEMKHCVASYAHRISEGKCAIYKIFWINERYTLEINKKMRIEQCKGKCNANAPKDLILELQANNYMPQNALYLAY